MRPVRHRTIVQELKFASELKRLVGLKVPRVTEFVEAIEWLLARKPEEGGKRLGSTDVWFIPSDYSKYKNELPIIIYYTFDDDIVNLLSIVESIYPPSEE